MVSFASFPVLSDTRKGDLFCLGAEKNRLMQRVRARAARRIDGDFLPTARDIRPQTFAHVCRRLLFLFF